MGQQKIFLKGAGCSQAPFSYHKISETGKDSAKAVNFSGVKQVSKHGSIRNDNKNKKQDNCIKQGKTFLVYRVLRNKLCINDD